MRTYTIDPEYGSPSRAGAVMVEARYWRADQERMEELNALIKEEDKKKEMRNRVSREIKKRKAAGTK